MEPFAAALKRYIASGYKAPQAMKAVWQDVKVGRVARPRTARQHFQRWAAGRRRPVAGSNPRRGRSRKLMYRGGARGGISSREAGRIVAADSAVRRLPPIGRCVRLSDGRELCHDYAGYYLVGSARRNPDAFIIVYDSSEPIGSRYGAIHAHYTSWARKSGLLEAPAVRSERIYSSLREARYRADFLNMNEKSRGNPIFVEWDSPDPWTGKPKHRRALWSRSESKKRQRGAERFTEERRREGSTGARWYRAPIRGNPRRGRRNPVHSGVLEYVNPTAGTLKVGGLEFRFLDPRYWSTGAEYRAYEALRNLQRMIGKSVEVEWEQHSAFGRAIFGRRKIRRVGHTNPRRASRAQFCSERLADPGAFDRRSLRTVVRREHRVTVGCPKGQYDASRQRCRVATKIQRVLHPAGEGKCPIGGREERNPWSVHAQRRHLGDFPTKRAAVRAAVPHRLAGERTVVRHFEKNVVTHGRYCPETVQPESRFDPRSFRMVVARGHRVIVGCPKGQYAAHGGGRCQHPMEAQRLLHPAGESRCPYGGRARYRRNPPGRHARLSTFYDRILEVRGVKGARAGHWRGRYKHTFTSAPRARGVDRGGWRRMRRGEVVLTGDRPIYSSLRD